jgi:hypothetical protein
MTVPSELTDTGESAPPSEHVVRSHIGYRLGYHINAEMGRYSTLTRVAGVTIWLGLPSAPEAAIPARDRVWRSAYQAFSAG